MVPPLPAFTNQRKEIGVGLQGQDFLQLLGPARPIGLMDLESRLHLMSVRVAMLEGF